MKALLKILGGGGGGGGKVFLQKELTNFRADLVDVWRKKQPRERLFSWFNFDKAITCRLDTFFVSRSVSEKTSACEIFPCVFSDHDFVSLILLLRRHQSAVQEYGSLIIPYCRTLVSGTLFENLSRITYGFNTLLLTLRNGGSF